MPVLSASLPSPTQQESLLPDTLASLFPSVAGSHGKCSRTIALTPSLPSLLVCSPQPTQFPKYRRQKRESDWSRLGEGPFLNQVRLKM